MVLLVDKKVLEVCPIRFDIAYSLRHVVVLLLFPHLNPNRLPFYDVPKKCFYYSLRAICLHGS